MDAKVICECCEKVAYALTDRREVELLPGIYRANREEYLRRNDGYAFRSYGEVFRRYFLRAKDPVPHPLWPRD